MDVERAAEHPTFELGGNTVTSLAAPSRGAHEAALETPSVPDAPALDDMPLPALDLNVMKERYPLLRNML